MKIAHWSLSNGSGLNMVAAELCEAEKLLGFDSVLIDSGVSADWEGGMDADVHVAHSHVPDKVRAKGGKVVWIGHGTPEHCFMTSVEAGLNGGHGFSDTLMLIQHWFKVADALVTFWPRHKAIWESMVHKDVKVHCVPLGVNKDFWKPTPSAGKYAGNPSVMTAENCHYIKWPLDLAIMWPWIVENVPDAMLHMFNLPNDQHRWWFPLMNANGSAYKTHLATGKLEKPAMLNAFASVDFYMNPVRYGDFNRMTMEARASGCKVISFSGNEYADFWIPEGDQRYQAVHMERILKGETAPREDVLPVPSIHDMAQGMKDVYESLFDSKSTQVAPSNGDREEVHEATEAPQKVV